MMRLLELLAMHAVWPNGRGPDEFRTQLHLLREIESVAFGEKSVAARTAPPDGSTLSDAEIKDLLDATLHGPLPHATMQRVFATLADVPRLRGIERTR